MWVGVRVKGMASFEEEVSSSSSSERIRSFNSLRAHDVPQGTNALPCET